MQNDGNLATYNSHDSKYTWGAKANVLVADLSAKAVKLVVENDGFINHQLKWGSLLSTVRKCTQYSSQLAYLHRELKY